MKALSSGGISGGYWIPAESLGPPAGTVASSTYYKISVPHEYKRTLLYTYLSSMFWWNGTLWWRSVNIGVGPITKQCHYLQCMFVCIYACTYIASFVCVPYSGGGKV